MEIPSDLIHIMAALTPITIAQQPIMEAIMAVIITIEHQYILGNSRLMAHPLELTAPTFQGDLERQPKRI